MDKNDLKTVRKQKFSQMEQQLKEIHHKDEDRLFYHHPSEDRIVLSHALYWTMTLPQYFKSKLRKEKLPTVTTFLPRDCLGKLSSPLGLPKEFFLLLRQYQEELSIILLDDIDSNYNKMKCRKIEIMMPKLKKMVESEMKGMR